MPMIRRGNEDHVHVLAIKHTAKILNGVGLGAFILGAEIEGFGQMRIVHVADHGAIHFGIEEKCGDVAAAHAAATDEAEAYFVVRAWLAGARRADERTGERRGAGDDGGEVNNVEASSFLYIGHSGYV